MWTKRWALTPLFLMFSVETAMVVKFQHDMEALGLVGEAAHEAFLQFGEREAAPPVEQVAVWDEAPAAPAPMAEAAPDFDFLAALEALHSAPTAVHPDWLLA